MDDKRIALQDETLRLLHLTDELIESIQHMDDSADAGAATERLQSWRALLADEGRKVKSGEVVLAVLGTVKAGKSTTVNAIVGAEVVPHRSMPMTALPTLIRHVPDAALPRLRLPRAAELAGYARAVADALAKAPLQNDEEALQFAARQIQSGTVPWDAPADGLAAVRERLMLINDTIRIGGKRDLQPPAELLASVADLPALDIGFRNVTAAAAGGGLALLDLPGFNEAGASETLRPLLKTEMRKSSALLVVIDYTQIGSEASDQLKAMLRELPEDAHERLFIVVNKFDQKGPNDLSEDGVRSQVASFSPKLCPDRIYCISASEGYMAGHVIDLLSSRVGRSGDPWMQRFIERCWAHDDSEEQRLVKARHCWDRSGLGRLLDDAIAQTHAASADLAVQSAAGKLQEYLKQICSILDLRIQALSASSSDLQGAIGTLTAEKNTVETSHAAMATIVASVQSKLKQAMRDAAATASGKIDTLVNDVFEGEQEAAPPQRSETTRFADMFAQTFGNLISTVHGPLHGIGTFHSKSEADEARQDVERRAEQVCEEAFNTIQQRAKAVIVSARHEMREGLQKEMQDLVNRVSSQLGQSGFSVRIVIPNAEARAVRKPFEIAVSQKTTSGTRLSDGWLPWFARLFSSTWGREQYRNEVWRIDYDEIKQQLKSQIPAEIQNYTKGIENAFVNQAEAENRETMVEVGDLLKDYIHHLRSELRERNTHSAATEDRKNRLRPLQAYAMATLDEANILMRALRPAPCLSPPNNRRLPT